MWDLFGVWGIIFKFGIEGTQWATDLQLLVQRFLNWQTAEGGQCTK